MSLFTDPMDRFFVGKLLFGLLFCDAFFRFLNLVLRMVLQPNGTSPPWEDALTFGLVCLLWFGLFQAVESRRRVVGRVRAASVR